MKEAERCACPSERFVHVVLEVDAPVHEGAKSDQAYGVVTRYWCVYDVAESRSRLACKCRHGEDTQLLYWYSGSPNAVEADGGVVMVFAWSDV